MKAKEYSLEEFREEVGKISCNSMSFEVNKAAATVPAIFNIRAKLHTYQSTDNIVLPEGEYFNGVIGDQMMLSTDILFLPEVCYQLAERLYMHELHDSFKINGKKPMCPHFVEVTDREASKGRLKRYLK